jgi:hypothetical protein
MLANFLKKGFDDGNITQRGRCLVTASHFFAAGAVK